MSNLVFLLGADADIQAAFEFYDGIQSGRGELFLRQVDVALGRLRQFPLSAPAFAGKFRRILVPDFPYGIFYCLEGERIMIAGVMDLRQDPAAFIRRFGESR